MDTRNFLNYFFLLIVLSTFIVTNTRCSDDSDGEKSNHQEKSAGIKLGAYYFDGWSGKSPSDDGSPENVWAIGMPRTVSKLLATDYAGREPVWGWRDDTPELMERQIDLAADNGIAYFSFVWTTAGDTYNAISNGAISIPILRNLTVHKSMYMFMDAPNNSRMEYCLLVASPVDGGTTVWEQVVDFWITEYFNHPRYMKVDGKPVIMFFTPDKFDKSRLDYLQEKARSAGFPGILAAGCGNCSVKDGFQVQTLYNTKPKAGLNNEEIYPFELLSDWNIWVWNRSSERSGMPYIPCVTAGWDRRPWEGEDGLNAPISTHFQRGTPEELENYLKKLVSWMDNNPEQLTKDRLAIIYAWNEIGEGGWLVPCKDDPDGEYLKAIGRVFSEK